MFLSENAKINFAALLFVLVCKYLIGCHNYSGYGKGPLHGDFEAQRHWQEITVHLPIQEWYFNSTNNDLQYWGLDYPPLTAYHSWFLGQIAKQINSSWVALYTSRGIETVAHKLFMRLSVLAADCAVFFPAAITFASCCITKTTGNWLKSVYPLVILLYPGLMLIDNGHFQYNNISLGLTLFSIIFLHLQRDLLASVAFVLALSYKQMELYHALPMFFYLLGTCFKGSEFWLWKLSKLGATVIVTFAIIWLPFMSSWSTFLQVLHRVFPVARGLYEDKVANIWCSLSVIIKWKQQFAPETMLKISTASTIVTALPSSVDLLFRPTINKFRYALISVAMAFFLCSFHVHEKSILLVALPVLLIYHEDAFAAQWFLEVSTFSMLPLLVKDGLTISYLSTMFMYHLVCKLLRDNEYNIRSHYASRKIFKYLYYLSLTAMGILTCTSLYLPAPSRFPDLWPLLIAVFSCAHYCGFLVYFTYKQLTSHGISYAKQTYARKGLKQQ